MYDVKILCDERNNLREELHNLKKCQLTYFTFSITVTGVVLLGLAGKWTDDGLTYIAPLVVLLPCWWIFFDKATTITRLVGYYRVLEHMIINSTDSKYFYIGWENAVAKYRKKEGIKKCSSKRKKMSLKAIAKYCIKKIKECCSCSKQEEMSLKKVSLSLYWIITWWTFCILSSSCALLYWLYGNFSWNLHYYTSLLGILVSIYFTGYKLNSLINGKNSYDACERTWQEILFDKRDFIRNHAPLRHIDSPAVLVM